MGFLNRLFAPAVPTDGEQLADALEQACNGGIVPHLRRLHEESDLDRSLNLMAASNFAGLVRQSCREVSDAVIRTMPEVRRRAEGGNGGGTLPSCIVTRDEIVSILAPCLNDFDRELDRYSHEHERFNRLVAETKRGVLGRSMEAGYAGAELGDALFGPLGAVAVAMFSGFFVGNAAQKAVEAGHERLNHAFLKMLEAWDEAMDALLDGAGEILKNYAAHVSAGAK